MDQIKFEGQFSKQPEGSCFITMETEWSNNEVDSLNISHLRVFLMESQHYIQESCNNMSVFKQTMGINHGNLLITWKSSGNISHKVFDEFMVIFILNYRIYYKWWKDQHKAYLFHMQILFMNYTLEISKCSLT